MKGQKEEARLSLLQEFWENMFHLSGCSVSLLYIVSYELKDDFTIFQPCFSRALYRTGNRSAYEALFFCAKRKINLSRMIFRLAQIDFHLSA
ncbi:hypothetical protein [Paraprevotella xylaniphila]|jgi:hypothetical protein|uniref:hypothetical protein n=1 Tax=Paraprevotella xylaniphila TaxID=454155 RepID=UPI0026DD953D|nr:hypothetical protein [Paraprevotella xylaniphila]